uniref:Uncharacterized protein n=1 Tax=Panagrolaimus sp. ES5 TaxID=591445 RepID=A0AC34GYR3_9BILA
MEMSRPSTPHVNNGNAPLTSYGCDYNASTSTTTSWPLTELALETPERLRLQFKKHTSPSIMSPPQRFNNTIRSPQTPKLIRGNQTRPGESFFKSSPSPLRRFKISHSSTPLSDKFGKNSTSRIEYRFCGNEPLPLTTTTAPSLSNVETNLDQTNSSANDSGFYSSFNDTSLLSQNLSWDQSNIFGDCNIFAAENSFSDPFNENLFEYSTDSFLSQTSTIENQFFPTPLTTSFKSQTTDFNASNDFTPAPPSVSSTTSANVTVSNALEIENEQKAAKLKQKTLEDEVLNSLDQYHDEPFNLDYAKDLDMTEFKKLKLVGFFA